MKTCAILMCCCLSGAIAYVVGSLHGREMQRQECKEEAAGATEFWQKSVESQKRWATHYREMWMKQRKHGDELHEKYLKLNQKLNGRDETGRFPEPERPVQHSQHRSRETKITIEGITLEKKKGSYFFEGTDVRAMFMEAGETRILATTTEMRDGELWEYDPHAKKWNKSDRSPLPPNDPPPESET